MHSYRTFSSSLQRSKSLGLVLSLTFSGWLGCSARTSGGTPGAAGSGAHAGTTGGAAGMAGIGGAGAGGRGGSGGMGGAAGGGGAGAGGGAGMGGQGGNAGSGGAGGAGGSGGEGGDPTIPSHVVVVAHQDDDLLFVNPELKAIIDRGENIVTAYVTSGNAGLGMDYVQEREAGAGAAYAFMAGVASVWACAPRLLGTKSIQHCVLSAKPNVHALFLRLVDGWADGHEPQSVFNLWTGATATSAAVDASGLSFTREELVATLALLLEEERATSVLTTDFSFRNKTSAENGDHADHEYSALFAAAASAAYPRIHSLQSFRTYNISDEPENLSAGDASMVQDTFSHYASCDRNLSPCTGGTDCTTRTCLPSSSLYTSWYTRHYGRSRGAAPLSGPITSPGGGCLQAESDGSVVTTDCSNGADQTWSWQKDFALVDPQGRCLTAPALNASTAPVLEACNQLPRQRWFVMDDGQIQLAAAPLPEEQGVYTIARCLEEVDSVQISPCAPTSAQAWSM